MKKGNKDINNIYQLDGKVPLGKAIPFGLQHVLAMFVANIAPIIIVAGACGLDTARTASLIQTAMIMSGIGSMVQLYSVGKIGAVEGYMPVVTSTDSIRLLSENLVMAMWLRVRPVLLTCSVPNISAMLNRVK